MRPGAIRFFEETVVHTLRRSVWIAAILLLGSASRASAATPVWKCGGLTMPGYGPQEVVAILDGGLQEKGWWAMDEIDPAGIDEVDITCWNPVNGKFGIEPAVPAVLVWTKSFVLEASDRREEVVQARKAVVSKELKLLYEAGGA